MSRLRIGAIPSYRLHKARGCAIVTIDGRDHYLGPCSKQKYAALIRAWQQRHEQPSAEPDIPLVPNEHPRINELVLAFLKHARAYYRPNHGNNPDAGCISDALAVLQEQGHGRYPADTFRPRDLKKVREAMIAKHWSRNYINSQINRIKRMFAYAVEEDLVSGSVYHALLAIKGLRKGIPGVRETKKVRPVPGDHIKPVLGTHTGSCLRSDPRKYPTSGTAVSAAANAPMPYVSHWKKDRLVGMHGCDMAPHYFFAVPFSFQDIIRATRSLTSGAVSASQSCSAQFGIPRSLRPVMTIRRSSCSLARPRNADYY